MQPKKILLADDDAEDKSIIQDAMELLNAGDVMWFSNDGEQVLKLLEEKLSGSEPLCLIVLDLNMPKMNGTQTLTKLKNDERFKHIPVIIYSTSINPLEKDKCLSLGALSYIAKPTTFKESMDTAKIFLSFAV